MNRTESLATVNETTARLTDPVSHLEPLGVPFRRFTTVLRRRSWVILLALVIGVGAAIALIMVTPRQYTAVASVLVEPQRTQVSDLQALSSDPANVPNMMRTQIDILRSPELARHVVNALNLTSRPEFTAGEGTLSKWFGLAQTELGLRSEPIPTASHEEIDEIAADKLLNKVYFGNEPRSNVLRIFAETEDPVLSANIANEFAEQFLDFKRHLKFDATQRAHEWFQDRLKELSVKVREADQLVQTYRERNGLTEFMAPRNGGASQPSTNVQQLAELSRQLAIVAAERSRREAQLEQATAIVHSQGRADALPEVLSSTLIQRLREQEAIAAGREAQLAAAVGDRSPELQAVRAQRRGLQQRIQDEMHNIVQSLTASVTEIRGQEAALRDALGRVREAVSTENAAEVGLHGLLAEAQATRSIYESFLNRATQLANVSGIQEPDASLVSRAIPPPAPSAPKAVRLVGVAVFLAFSIGLAIAFLLDRLRTGYSSPDDLEADLGVMSLGVIPTVTLAPRPIAPVGKRALDFAAALSKVRGSLQVLDDNRRPKVVMVTSAIPREGKSIFAISLALSAGRAGWKTLLIDCDMRCPAVAHRLGLPSQPGLQGLLAEPGLVAPEGFMHRISSGLDVLPAGISDHNPQDLLDSAQMTRLLDYARKTYDFVILDTTPVMPVADALVLSRQADATIMAVRWERTPRAVVKKAMRLLHGSGAQILGVLLTQVDLRSYGLSDVTTSSSLRRKYRDYYAAGV